LKSSTSDTASKITATEAKAGPASERGDNRDPPCHRPGMGFREQADASKARHRRRIVRNRNSTWPRLSA
jgi:hypothetical protein